MSIRQENDSGMCCEVFQIIYNKIEIVTNEIKSKIAKKREWRARNVG